MSERQGGLNGQRVVPHVVPQVVPRITQTNGEPLFLRGFSNSSSAKLSLTGLPELARSDIQREFDDMGTNFVRFLISWRAVEPAPGVYDQHYLDQVAEYVQWYAALGYWVMLDMHQDLWGTGITAHRSMGNGAPDWATFTDDEPVRDHQHWQLYYLEPGVIRAFDYFWRNRSGHEELMDHYVGAWRAVAQRFADVPAVIAYDLVNEPYGGSLQGKPFETGPLADLYRKTVAAIREVDHDTWICLQPQSNGFNWGKPTALPYIPDPRPGGARIAFAPHLFPLAIDMGEGFVGPTEKTVRRTVRRWAHNAIEAACRLGGGSPVPVLVGEFGLGASGGAMAYVGHVMDMADEHGFGVCYWCRDDPEWGPYDSDHNPRPLVAHFARPLIRSSTVTIGAVSTTADSCWISIEPGGQGGGEIQISLPQQSFSQVRPRDSAGQPVLAGVGVSGVSMGMGVGVLVDVAPAEVEGVRVDGGRACGWDPATRILAIEVAPGASWVEVAAGTGSHGVL